MDVPIDNSLPYTASMRRGEPQFNIIFFNIEILERYLNNPKYVIMDLGYRGSIYVKNEYLEDKTIEKEYIKNYGMAYISINPLERAIGVFVRDLFHLSSQKQMLWKSFELIEQEKCKIHKEFIEDTLLGLWTDKKVWIFQALLEEMEVINKQCEAIGIPHLFNKTYLDFYERPEGYRNIFLPTSKNYYDFVLALEKITVSNISIKTFLKQSPYVKCIKRKDELGKEKGSLIMLEEWLLLNVKTTESIQDLIINPLKDIRKQRQIPAHQFMENTYDISFYQKQDDLINRTYDAIREIRLLFSNHPLARGVEVPENLKKADGVVCY